MTVPGRRRLCPLLERPSLGYRRAFHHCALRLNDDGTPLVEAAAPAPARRRAGADQAASGHSDRVRRHEPLSPPRQPHAEGQVARAAL